MTCLSAPATPPAITQQPSPATNCEGTTATFSVAASGSGLIYQWQQNDVDLGDNGHYSGSATATLTITNVNSGDAANYRCQVSNATGWTNSAEAALTVRAATTIAQQPSDADVGSAGRPTSASPRLATARSPTSGRRIRPISTTAGTTRAARRQR